MRRSASNCRARTTAAWAKRASVGRACAQPGVDTAAILLTSGSEAQPKAVPLTHANILANLRDVLEFVKIYRDDCLIGFLPPFHSFG